MRLDEHTRTVIREAAKKFFGVPVLLFGSRLDDTRKGGDIDLYLEADLPPEDVVRRELGMVAYIWRRIGERKIDLVINTGRTQNPIYEVAKRGEAV
jgi:hypothetical protein